MGVSGCGKTLIGRKLAEKFKCQFIEGDDYHTIENKHKMKKGIALTDEDREGWLFSLKDRLSQSIEQVFVSCSALKKSYREILCKHPYETIFIHLDVSKDTLETRLNDRKEHFFNPSLLRDQLNTLEVLHGGENGFSVNSDQDPKKIIADILYKLNDEKYALH